MILDVAVLVGPREAEQEPGKHADDQDIAQGRQRVEDRRVGFAGRDVGGPRDADDPDEAARRADERLVDAVVGLSGPIVEMKHEPPGARAEGDGREDDHEDPQRTPHAYGFSGSGTVCDPPVVVASRGGSTKPPIQQPHAQDDDEPPGKANRDGR